jgi:hypothetical protein
METGEMKREERMVLKPRVTIMMARPPHSHVARWAGDNGGKPGDQREGDLRVERIRGVQRAVAGGVGERSKR